MPISEATMSDSYSNASDTLAAAIGAAKNSSVGYHYDTEHMTVDQRLKVAEILALLSIAEDLSAIRHHGIARSGQITDRD